MTEARRLKCHAHNRRGEPCGQWAVDGMRVCRMHGAGGGRPIIHGRYSKVLKNSGLVSHYLDAVENKSLFDLKEPIALLEACLQKASERAAERDTPDFRRRCLELYEDAQQASKAGDTQEFVSKMRDLGQLLREGVSEDRATSEIGLQAERLAKRLEGAWRIHLDKAQVYNKQQMVSLLGQFMEFVRIEAGAIVAQRIQSRLVGELSVAHRDQLSPRVVENDDEEHPP